MPSSALPFRLRTALLLLVLPLPSLLSQVVQIRDAAQAQAEQPLSRSATLPTPSLSQLKLGQVSLQPGLFRERRELVKAYLLRLKTEDLLQNHLLEAGVRTEKPVEQMHLGWESPSCQLRGHFAGHWLSAASRFAARDHDPMLAARVTECVQTLARCQELNGGQWLGSIPEKYFTILSEGKPIWSPQYTVHKTMLGLLDAAADGSSPEALGLARRSADWFLAWTDRMQREHHGEAIYGGESAGMLELWADLYAATGDERLLQLASRYAMPDLFRGLLAGNEVLGNQHANASIPWFQGAARLYEVTGDARYRELVERFWQQAVVERGMFATTGNNAGEYWVPKGQFARFLGSHTQEHCTVYNMIRVAQYLFRWTGEARYADYIENALYNGILAQQNPNTGMVSYFLPLQPGARKVWGTETRDFWCCHGTLVQAQATHEDLIYYRAQDSLTVAQFIPSQANFELGGAQVKLTQGFDPQADTHNFSAPDDATQTAVRLTVSSDKATRLTLRLRQPAWALGKGTVSVNGVEQQTSLSKTGFLELPITTAQAEVRVVFSKRLVRVPLPGDTRRFALQDGPIVLAALCDTEPEVSDNESPLPQYEHQYVEGREWQGSHYLLRTRQGTVTLKPLHEVADERYTVYFSAGN